MWNKNVTALNEKEIADSIKILEKYNLRITDIASPLFKVDWPGAPLSRDSPRHDQFHADFDFKEQRDALLTQVHRADQGLSRLTASDCFDFWRLEDQKP